MVHFSSYYYVEIIKSRFGETIFVICLLLAAKLLFDIKEFNVEMH